MMTYADGRRERTRVIDVGKEFMVELLIEMSADLQI